MNNPQLTQVPRTKTGMLIRRHSWLTTIDILKSKKLGALAPLLS
jgi:hypothetical protein